MTSTELSDHALNFLADNGWINATRSQLPADASSRTYHRLKLGTQHAMLMVARREKPVCPPHASDAQRLDLGWNAISRLAGGRIDAFCGIAGHLRKLGLSAPRIFAADHNAGLALTEDLGEHTYAEQILAHGANETELYTFAAKALAIIHSAPIPKSVTHEEHNWPILTYDELALRAGANLFADRAPQHLPVRMNTTERSEWDQIISSMMAQAMDFPRSLILRDCHAENLIWMNSRKGVKQTGMIDFQDAVAGWGEWDMDMLINDARRTVSEHARNSAISAWLDQTGSSEKNFHHRIAVLGTLNALRIVGVFCKLIVDEHKKHYQIFLERQCKLLGQRMQHPANNDMAALLNRIAPELIP